ncbi:MAG TPA: hypothetical protein PKW49_10935 [Paludibacteraceae bacterium]|nr:hypothetical protein [Paludibacteraceae bacterium]HQF50890.1 hypothetical protein [Paludibacteraceae bacterium]
MMKRTTWIAFTASLFFAEAIAADCSEGIEFFKYGDFKIAKEIFSNCNSSNTAEKMFYLGEIYFAEEKRDSAFLFYNKGKMADENYVFNEIGLLKLTQKSNPSVTTAELQKIAKKNKKRADVLTSIAKAFFQNGEKELALNWLHEAQSVNNQYAESFVLEGDIYASMSEYGKASSFYEMALTTNPKCEEAYIRYANIYTNINPKTAIEVLNRCVNVNPSSALAQRALGDAYYADAQFSKAAQAYAQYAESPYYQPADLSKYAMILLFNGEFQKSTDIVNEALRKDPNNLIMNRLLMYNLYEQKQYEQSFSVTKKIFNEKNKSQLIWMDHFYYGKLLSKKGMKTDALKQYETALLLDSTKNNIYKEMAEVYESTNNYEMAIRQFQKFIDKEKAGANVNDILTLGKYNYYAGNQISEGNQDSLSFKKLYLTKADSLFNIVEKKVPKNYLGHLWRARTNSALDPESEQGLAKPYYESALTVLDVKNPRETRIVIECYSYLGYYYFLKKETDLSKSYWNKIIEVDPQNEVAKKALQGMK